MRVGTHDFGWTIMKSDERSARRYVTQRSYRACAPESGNIKTESDEVEAFTRGGAERIHRVAIHLCIVPGIAQSSRQPFSHRR